MPNAKAKSQKLGVLHERFGHVNPAMLLQLLKNDVVVGLQLSSKNLPSRVCEGCAMGKNHKHSFPTRIPILRVKKPIEFFSCKCLHVYELDFIWQVSLFCVVQR
jgi:hypothetical protein